MGSRKVHWMASGRVRDSRTGSGGHTGDAAFFRALMAVNKTVWIFFTGIWHWNWRRRKWPCLWLDGDPDHRALQPSPQGQQWAISRVRSRALQPSHSRAPKVSTLNGSRRPHSRSLVRLFLSPDPPCSQ